MNKAEALQMAESTRRTLNIAPRQQQDIHELRQALRRLVDISGQLNACGFITGEMTAGWPSHWIILRKPLGLEVAGDTTDEDQRWAAFELACKLSHEANQTWDQLSPLWTAMRHLCEAIGRASSGKPWRTTSHSQR
jgi:hypothetical protein